MISVDAASGRLVCVLESGQGDGLFLTKDVLSFKDRCYVFRFIDHIEKKGWGLPLKDEPPKIFFLG